MHGLNELDLVRQHRAELRREVEDIRLAQRLRSAGARSAPGFSCSRGSGLRWDGHLGQSASRIAKAKPAKAQTPGRGTK